MSNIINLTERREQKKTQEEAIANSPENDPHIQAARKGLWFSERGEMKIEDMDTDHIRNCLKFLQHRYASLYNKISIQNFNAELTKRGEF